MNSSVDKVYLGDSKEVLERFPANRIDTVITDPPYGLSNLSRKVVVDVLSHWLSGDDDYHRLAKGFRSEEWDGFVPTPRLWKEVYRVLKPGATMFVFAGTRTQDLMSISLRLGGFQVKDTLMWLYGSGFPKAANISRGIDKRLGYTDSKTVKLSNNVAMAGGNYTRQIHISQSDKAKKWEGYKSHGLKPAYEPIIMVMKPNEGSYVDNALDYGVSGLNIDGGRISVDMDDNEIKGRYPSNVLMDEEAAEQLDNSVDPTVSTLTKPDGRPVYAGKTYLSSATANTVLGGYEDRGGVSRFFYVAKASPHERAILDGSGVSRNNHPTVKPIALIDYLVRLSRMPGDGQIYLDPFFGSGTLGVVCKRLGRHWIGIEKSEKYVQIANNRIKYANGPLFEDEDNG